jgi:hypothetical protein
MRRLRYFTRPTLLAAERDRIARGWSAQYEHPRFTRLPPGVRFPVIYDHAFHSDGWMLCVVLWPEEGIAWWMNVSFERFRSLPTVTVHPDLYRW